MTAPDWASLGRAVRARREELRLPQDLVSRGGPSEFTVRKIERAETEAIRNRTKTQLEDVLQWERGDVDRILAGQTSGRAAWIDPEALAARIPPFAETCFSAPALEEPTAAAWERLGKNIEDRRHRFGLSQEALVKYGGPSHQIVRNVEKGLAADYRTATFRKFDRSLQWRFGTAERILAGTATAEEIDEVVVGSPSHAADVSPQAGEESGLSRAAAARIAQRLRGLADDIELLLGA